MPGPKKQYEGYLSLRLKPDLRRQIEEMAVDEKRTSSQLARILLEEAIAAREPKKGKKKHT